MPQLWSCSCTPVSQLTSRLNTRDGRTLCQGSCRTFFQPLTTSRSFSISARKRGISWGSSWRSASRVITSSPRAWAKPALKAAALPKLRRNRRPADPRVGRRQAADHLPRAVGRAVVDEAPRPGRSPAAAATSDNSRCRVARLSASLKTGMTTESIIASRWKRPATAVAGGVNRCISPRDRSRGALSRH